MMLDKPIQITEQNWSSGTVPVLSVFNWVYNHKDFIRESIESILIQKTSFPVEIIIHDDASKDGTKEIILEYQEKHPRLFRNILHEVNQWSQGKSVMRQLFKKPRGKYIALTHGDDFWTDPLKLQKQVDFLENNESYIACFHKTKYVDQLGQNINYKTYIFSNSNQTYRTSDLIERHVIPTASLIFRNQLNNFSHLIVKKKKILQGDVFLELLLSTLGDFYFFDEYMSTYRIHKSGISTSKRNRKYGLKSYMILLDEFDKFTVWRYAQHIELKKQSLLRENISRNNTFKNRFNVWLIHRKMIKEISLKQERELIYKYLIPRLYKYLKGY